MLITALRVKRTLRAGGADIVAVNHEDRELGRICASLSVQKISGSTCIALTVVDTSDSNRGLGLHRRLVKGLAIGAMMGIEMWHQLSR